MSIHDDWCEKIDVDVGAGNIESPCSCKERRQDAEIERLKTLNGQLTADLMGCRDGALVRDLRAEINRLEAELAEAKKQLVMLAKLSSEHPDFDNPFRAYDAQYLRDKILRGD